MPRSPFATLALLAGAVTASIGVSLNGEESKTDHCFMTRRWLVAPDSWQQASGDLGFPEAEQVAGKRDLGLAFSGGGTRAATAALGELRGLASNGWTAKARYMTAVSGGAWAVVPYVYSEQSADALLGTFQRPEQLALNTIDTPSGSLEQSVTTSGLLANGVFEGLDIGRAYGSKLPFADVITGRFGTVFDALRKHYHGEDAERRDKTYARVLERIFLRPTTGFAVNAPFAWNNTQITDIGSRPENRGLITQNFALTQDRPFLIVGGTLVHQQAADHYPRLIPVEYTPMYSGVRQQFGDDIGGSYVWSWAYDSQAAQAGPPGFVSVCLGTKQPTFTLADLIASTGAAPQLALLLGAVPGVAADVQQRFAGMFPSFSHFAVQGDRVGSVARFPHGDGGFSDNLGLMPLLARQVHNIIVFVNSAADPAHESSMRAFFQRLGQDIDGDKSMNAVFDGALLDPLIRDLNGRAADGRAPVACYSGWHVNANELYNVREYGGLNICWVFNMRAAGWIGRLAPALRAELFPEAGGARTDRSKYFADFPHFKTFGENLPKVLQLRADQVNALANFGTWLVTDKSAVDEMQKHIGAVLQ